MATATAGDNIKENEEGDGIEHVVLLMLENHSFDQMLGALQQIFPDLNGVTPELANTRSNPTLSGVPIYQHATTERQMAFDPKHEHENVMHQLENNNGGFVMEFEHAYSQATHDDLQEVMGYYPVDFLPALQPLVGNSPSATTGSHRCLAPLGRTVFSRYPAPPWGKCSCRLAWRCSSHTGTSSRRRTPFLAE